MFFHASTLKATYPVVIGLTGEKTAQGYPHCRPIFRVDFQCNQYQKRLAKHQSRWGKAAISHHHVVVILPWGGRPAVAGSTNGMSPTRLRTDTDPRRISPHPSPGDRYESRYISDTPSAPHESVVSSVAPRSARLAVMHKSRIYASWHRVYSIRNLCFGGRFDDNPTHQDRHHRVAPRAVHREPAAPGSDKLVAIAAPP